MFVYCQDQGYVCQYGSIFMLPLALKNRQKKLLLATHDPTLEIYAFRPTL